MKKKPMLRVPLGFATLLPLIVAGCSHAMQAKTVSYYRAHDAEREALFKRCADDPGTLGKSAACVNVEQAEAIKGIGSFRKLAPMHFAAPPGPGAKKRLGVPRPDGGPSR